MALKWVLPMEGEHIKRSWTRRQEKYLFMPRSVHELVIERSQWAQLHSMPSVLMRSLPSNFQHCLVIAEVVYINFTNQVTCVPDEQCLNARVLRSCWFKPLFARFKSKKSFRNNINITCLWNMDIEATIIGELYRPVSLTETVRCAVLHVTRFKEIFSEM